MAEFALAKQRAVKLEGMVFSLRKSNAAINQRPRRGDQATYQAELDAEAGWRVPAVVRLEAEAACREVALAPTED